MKRLRNKRGEATIACMMFTLAVFLFTRAHYTGELDYPQWTKDNTVDTVENPAPAEWDKPIECNWENCK